MTNQPVWKLIANLGDVNPLDYGGLFVYVDETGVYPPEMERVEPLDDTSAVESTAWETHRAVLENLKTVEVDGRTLIIPARYDATWPHPIESYDEWFNRDLGQVAESIGADVTELRAFLCSDTPTTRAVAWRAIADYHGWENLDSYPNRYTDRAELERRYGLKVTA